MILSHSINALWWALIAVECIAAIAGASTKIYGRYPVFFAYLVFSCLRSFLLKSLMLDHYFWYCWAYYIGEAIEGVLLIGVVWELARPLFFPWWIIPAEPKKHFCWSLGLLLSISVATGFLGHSVSAIGEMWYWTGVIRTLNASAYVLLFGVATLGIMLSRYLGIPWRRKAVLIAAGMTARFGLDAYFWFLFQSSGRAQGERLLWLNLSAWILAYSIWALAALAQEEPSVSLSQGDLNAIESALTIKVVPLQRETQ